MVLSPAFTPQAATLGAVGGALIGALAVARIAGRRGMLPSATPVPLVTPSVMLGGFVIKTCLDGPAVSLFDAATATAMPADAASLLALVGAAACVGAGAKLGQGCTSGNGINGLAALSKASLVFVLTFMGAGATAASLLGSGAAHAGAAAAAVAPDFPWLVLALGAAGIAAQLLLPASPAYKPDTLSVASIASPADALADLGAGLAFAAALAVSGMVKPSKVLGFLDLGSAAGWDPTLACVMGAALCVAAPGYRLLGLARGGSEARGFPLADAQVAAWAARPVDANAVIGGALFGLGWGVSGMCPGPAMVNAGGLAPDAALFVAVLFGVRVFVPAAGGERNAKKRN